MSRRPRAGEAGRPFTIKVTDAERASWALEAGDRALSEWAREVLNKAAKRRYDAAPERRRAPLPSPPERRRAAPAHAVDRGRRHPVVTST